LTKGHDATRTPLDRFIESSPRNPVITGEGDQLLDVLIVLVPKFD
jgi:hypothetical protein